MAWLDILEAILDLADLPEVDDIPRHSFADEVQEL